MADVFISWSGDASKHVAGVLYEYLPQVIQGMEVFFSDQDIPTGTQWQGTIQGELNSTKYGIICVTPDNTDSPWLFFEAGAISSHTAEATRVSPLAINMSKEALPSPLQGYNAVDLDLDGFVKLVKSIHATVKQSVPWSTIEASARYHWTLMEPRLAEMPTTKEAAPAFDQQAAIIEIRSAVRELTTQLAVRNPGSRQPKIWRTSNSATWADLLEFNNLPAPSEETKAAAVAKLNSRLKHLIAASNDGDLDAAEELQRLGFTVPGLDDIKDVEPEV